MKSTHRLVLHFVKTQNFIESLCQEQRVHNHNAFAVVFVHTIHYTILVGTYKGSWKWGNCCRCKMCAYSTHIDTNTHTHTHEHLQPHGNSSSEMPEPTICGHICTRPISVILSLMFAPVCFSRSVLIVVYSWLVCRLERITIIQFYAFRSLYSILYTAYTTYNMPIGIVYIGYNDENCECVCRMVLYELCTYNTDVHEVHHSNAHNSQP